MSHTVGVLCTPAVAAGFRLAGLRPIEAADAADGARRFAALLDTPGLGVVLVEDGIYAALADGIRHRIARHPLPIVVPFPGPAWTPPREGAEAFIAEVLRRAVGYRVRLG